MAMVREFQVKHGFPLGLAVGEDPRTDLVRLHLVAEEGVAELALAIAERDRVKVADALADLLYVTLGAATTWGIPLAEVFDEVHRSNMTKAVSDTRLRDKGATYEPADVAGVLATGGPRPSSARELYDEYKSLWGVRREDRDKARLAFSGEWFADVCAWFAPPGRPDERVAVVELVWNDPVRPEYRRRDSWVMGYGTKGMMDFLHRRGVPVLLVLVNEPGWVERHALLYDPADVREISGRGRSLCNIVVSDLVAAGRDVVRLNPPPWAEPTREGATC